MHESNSNDHFELESYNTADTIPVATFLIRILVRIANYKSNQTGSLKLESASFYLLKIIHLEHFHLFYPKRHP